MSHEGSLQEELSRFDPISLSEMDGVKLQARMDTKFMFAESDLIGILEQLRAEYRLLVVDGERGTRYRSLYLDTPDLALYLAHHNGRIFRSKVRYREYLGSGLCYLEVKRKTGRGGTDKARRKVACIPDRPTAEDLRFIKEASRLDEELVPVMWNHFTRLTLVHRQRPERLTIDRSLRFSTDGNERSLDGICVAELKEERADRSSPFARIMRERGLRPSGMSKYCTGMITLGAAPKSNNFKALLLRMDALRKAA